MIIYSKNHLLYFFKLTCLSSTKKYWMRVVWGREKEKVGRATCIFKDSNSLKFFLLLSCDFHTVQFTCLTCTMQWFLVYLQSCVTIVTGMELFLFFIFDHEAYEILVPSIQGLNPRPLSLTCWTAREVPPIHFFPSVFNRGKRLLRW